MNDTMPPIFDGHNDVLLRLLRKDVPDKARAFIDGDGAGHLDLPRMKQGGFAGGMFAVFIPSLKDAGNPDELMRQANYDVPMPGAMTSGQSMPAAFAMTAILARIERLSDARVKICRSASELRQAIDAGVLATVLHFEGAEPIDQDLDALDVFYKAGLRSLGPVWSRSNIFGHGVPFRFPSTPDVGGGLTDAGKALVKACNGLRIVIDLSHITEQGFWDVAKLSDAPLIATHSNAHALCTHSRNLTDRQLAAIKETGGMVGVNFATCFLRADGRMSADTPLADMLRHMDYLIEHVGEDHVGLGSDFDGATVPADIGDVAGLPRLRAAMRAHGYGEALMRKLCYESWLNVLERSWGH